MDRVGLSVSHFEPDEYGRFPAAVFETLSAVDMMPEPIQPGDVTRAGQLQGLCGIITDGRLPDLEVLKRADDVQAVGCLASGFDHLPVDALQHENIACLNAPTAFAGDVAQAALTLMLAVAGRLTERQNLMRQGPQGWLEGAALPGTSLRGKTLGVLGPGEIGQSLFKLTAPFEFRKLAFGARVRPELAQAHGFSYVGLEELCHEADILVLTCPLNDQTRGILNAKRLSLLKETAFLVNVARGPVVDEAALIRALTEKKIAGAGLDVFADEPALPENPLLSLENVVATPHGLAVTRDGYLAALKEVATGMRAVLEGRQPKNSILFANAKPT